jgi:uncharacterized protein
MTSLLRVVLDTNVLVSGLVFGGGLPGQLRARWQRGAFMPLASASTVQELVRVLAYPKFGLSRADQQELLADFLPCATTVQIPVPPPAVPACRDPLDVPFLHLAVAGHAEVLVSGDKGLLSLTAEFEGSSGCRILRLDAFLQP